MARRYRVKYLLTPDAAQQLYPRAESDEAADAPEHPDAQEPQAQPLLHMALSPDERFIAVGDQGGQHLLLNRVARCWAGGHRCRPAPTTPHSPTTAPGCWPIPATFTRAVPGCCICRPKALGQPPCTSIVPRRCRAAAVSSPQLAGGCHGHAAGHGDEGDAAGYLHALSDDGQLLWHHHIGGALNALDTSPDGSTIVAASHSGYVWCGCGSWGSRHGPFAISTSPYTGNRALDFLAG